MNSVSNQAQLGFRGYFNNRIKNPPHVSPSTPKEKNENIMALGVATGMDIMNGFNNFKKMILITGGAIIGACAPRKLINNVSSFISGKKNVVLAGKIPIKTRGKAALIGAVITTGLVTTAVFAAKMSIKGVKAVFRSDDEKSIIHPAYKEQLIEMKSPGVNEK